MSQLFLVFVYVFMLQMLPQISKCCEFGHNCVRKIENAADLKDETNLKPPQILKWHKFQSVTNVPFYSYFCPNLSLCFPTLSYFFFIICSPSFFLLFHIAVLDNLHSAIAGCSSVTLVVASPLAVSGLTILVFQITRTVVTMWHHLLHTIH